MNPPSPAALPSQERGGLLLPENSKIFSEWIQENFGRMYVWASGGMVYTADLKSSAYQGLWVQIPPRPPRNNV